MRHPDLTEYTLHKVIDDIDLEGTTVPGLRGVFLRRDLGDRIATVGVYAYRGERLFMAWGYVGETHCRYTAVRDGHGWGPVQRGCPVVRARGIGLAVRRADGAWLVRQPGPDAPPPTAYTAGSGSMAGRRPCRVS